MNGEAAPAEAPGWWARAKARWSYSEAEEAAPVEKTPHDLLKELSDLAPAEAARTLKRRGDTKRRSRAYREARACYEAAYAAAETDDSAEAAGRLVRWPSVNLLAYHFPMIADEGRNGCFDRALVSASEDQTRTHTHSGHSRLLGIVCALCPLTPPRHCARACARVCVRATD